MNWGIRDLIVLRCVCTWISYCLVISSRLSLGSSYVRPAEGDGKMKSEDKTKSVNGNKIALLLTSMNILALLVPVTVTTVAVVQLSAIKRELAELRARSKAGELSMI